MKVRLATWSIKTLISREEKINPKPQYQRTSVWNLKKKRLLINSILRGYDLPKFYLRETPSDPMYDYEVTDGQQRMRSIWEFVSSIKGKKYSLDDDVIDGTNTKGLSYNNLGKLKNSFDDYKLNIAIIENSTPEEIRTLFARLQMGSVLNKVELRHALASNIGAAILSIVENHKFFPESRISNSRYKHQDYLDHVVTLMYHDGNTDLKASNIEDLYEKLSNASRNEYSEYLKKANKILDWMRDINNEWLGVFRNKWAFVDTFWLLYNQYESISNLKASKFVEIFSKFESDRLKYQSNPEVLIEGKEPSVYEKNLYDYIYAFKYSGNEQGNISARNNVFNSIFLNQGVW